MKSKKLISAFLFIIFLTLLARETRAQRRFSSDPLKPYKEIIPSTAIKYKGFLTLNRVGDKFYIEIPPKHIGVDMLFVRYVGAYGQKRIRWEKLGNQLVLRIPPAIVINETTDSAYIAWTKSSRKTRCPAVVAEFSIETISSDGAFVVDATELFTRGYNLSFAYDDVDYSKTRVVKVAIHRDDILVETTAPKLDGTGTREVVRQLVRLPDVAMKPRLFDSRVGFFGIGETGTYIDINKDHKNVNMIRWRMEKKNPSLTVSEPVRPIIIYIPKSIPQKWHPYIKKGIEDWQVAFEAAGFKNAILAKEEPNDDTTFSLHDMRNSYVNWFLKNGSDDRNKGGGNATRIIDEHTGEILKATVNVGETSLRTVSYAYFVQSAPLDPRARRYPFPDDLTGELLRRLISHETGHALGLMDGNYGKFVYPVDSLRSTTWLTKMAHSPSVMNYSRNNYVAQPEDKIEPYNLIQRVGPADIFNIRWGYTPILEAKKVDDELPMIERWARELDKIPYYRFFRAPGIDPSVIGPYTLDVVDDNNPVKSSKYGLMNVRRVVRLLSNADVELDIEDKRDLFDLYNETIEQRTKILSKVVDLIGGYTIQHKSPWPSDAVYTPIPNGDQRAAMKYLDTAGLSTPSWLVNSGIALRFDTFASNKIGEEQVRLLERILAEHRLERVLKQEKAADRRQASYPLRELLADVQKSVWKELYQKDIVIDSLRQQLQTSFILQLTKLANPLLAEHILPVEKKATLLQLVKACKANFEQLRSTLINRQSNIVDKKTKAHIEACIKLTLGGKEKLKKTNNK